MSSAQSRCNYFRGILPTLIAIGAVSVMGCQTAAFRRHNHRSVDAGHRQAPQLAGQYDIENILTPSPSDSAFSQYPEHASNDPFLATMNPVVFSETEAKELFNRLKGKLRADESGAIVEADLSYSDVSDEHLPALAAFAEIRELDLTGTQVHDLGLVGLPHFDQLQAIKLKGTGISSEGLLSISQIPTLILIDASSTDVSDEGLSLAENWTSLRYLSLNNTSISDAAIPHLKTLETLKGLSLLNTRVSKDGVRELKQALPDCLIVTKPESEVGPSASAVPRLRFPTSQEAVFTDFTGNSGTQLEQLVQLAGQQPQLAVHLASIYSAKEQWPEAVRILAAAAAVDPTNQSVQLSLGAALARTGNAQAAKPHLAQAVGEAAANYNLGMIAYENNLQICANHFERAVAADPTLTDARARLQEVQQELAHLKRQRMSSQPATSTRVLPDDTPLEVIPAPSVHSASFSNSWTR